MADVDYKGLTLIEQDVYDWMIKNKIPEELGTRWWSLRKIAEGVGRAPSTMLTTVHALERKGKIKIIHGPGGAYGYEVL